MDKRGLADDFRAGTGEMGRAPRIVIATILRPHGGTGVQSHFSELESFVRSRGLPISVVTPFSSGGALRNAIFGIRRILAPISGACDVWWYRFWHGLYLQVALRRELRRLQSLEVVVYAQCPVSAAAALRVRRQVPVLMAVHFLVSQADEWVQKGRIERDSRLFKSIRRVEERVFREVDGVVFVSAAARAELAAKPAPKVRVETIPNFISYEVPDGRPRRRRDIASIGSLEARKNHRFALEALAAARDLGFRYTLDIIGTGPERRSLRRRIRELNLNGQVRLLGYVPNAGRRLAGYRLYVHTATSEAMGIALIEAMAAGIPVIAPKLGGIPEVIRTSVDGRFWDLDDPVAGAKVLIDVLEDDRTCRRMACAAQERFRTEFDAVVVIPRLYGFLTGTARSAGMLASTAGERERTMALSSKTADWEIPDR